MNGGHLTCIVFHLQDHKVTLQQNDEFFNTKIAPKELVDEIKVARDYHHRSSIVNLLFAICGMF